VIKLAYYNLKLYDLEIYDLIVAKVALKVYRYRHRGKSLFTYRLLTELKIPLPYISDGPKDGQDTNDPLIFLLSRPK